MTPCVPENFSTWLVDWSLVTGNTMPPRDPNDDEAKRLATGAGPPSPAPKDQPPNSQPRRAK
jgi:hypothetical protein